MQLVVARPPRQIASKVKHGSVMVQLWFTGGSGVVQEWFTSGCDGVALARLVLLETVLPVTLVVLVVPRARCCRPRCRGCRGCDAVGDAAGADGDARYHQGRRAVVPRGWCGERPPLQRARGCDTPCSTEQHGDCGCCALRRPAATKVMAHRCRAVSKRIRPAPYTRLPRRRLQHAKKQVDDSTTSSWLVCYMTLVCTGARARQKVALCIWSSSEQAHSSSNGRH